MPSTQTDRLFGLTTAVAVKAPALCASTANLTLSSTQVIDGVSVSTGDRVLVKDQADATENGIYIVDSSTWSRAADVDGSRDLVVGTVVYVSTGSTANTNFERFFVFESTSSTSSRITPGTDTITISPSNALTATVSSTATVSDFGSSLIQSTDADVALDLLGVNPLGIGRGGTSSTSASAALDALGISPLGLGRGGTSSTSAADARTALGLATVSSDEAAAGASTETRAWTAERVSQTVTGSTAIPTNWAFIGSTQTITAGAQVSEDHGLAATPLSYRAAATCSSSDNQFPIGAEIDVTNAWFTAGGVDYGGLAWVTSTAMFYQFGTNQPITALSTAGNLLLLSSTKWSLQLYAKL